MLADVGWKMSRIRWYGDTMTLADFALGQQLKAKDRDFLWPAELKPSQPIHTWWSWYDNTMIIMWRYDDVDIGRCLLSDERCQGCDVTRRTSCQWDVSHRPQFIRILKLEAYQAALILVVVVVVCVVVVMLTGLAVRVAWGQIFPFWVECVTNDQEQQPLLLLTICTTD